jgi:hypothetical protein
MPAPVIVPNAAFQVTVRFDAVPCTVAPNGTAPPVTDEAVAGDSITEVTLGVWPEATVTVALADFVESNTEVTPTLGGLGAHTDTPKHQNQLQRQKATKC